MGARRGRLRAMVVAVAMVGTTVVLWSPTAEAAEVDISFVLQDGSAITLAGTDLTLFDPDNPDNPDSRGIVGTWDDATGAVEGEFVANARRSQQRLDDPIAGNIDLLTELSAPPVAGTIDATTGEVTLLIELDVSLTFEQLVPDVGAPIPLNVHCTIDDIELELSSSPDGEPIDVQVNPATFVVTAEGFTVDAPDCGPSGAQPDPAPAIVDLVRGRLVDSFGLPTADTSATLAFEAGDLVPATPVEPPATTPPAADLPPPATEPPVPATPMPASPRVTG